MAIYFLSSSVRAWGDIPSGFELLLDLFLVFWSGRTGQILFLEFSKDGPADSREFTYGGLANQQVILNELLHFSCCQVSRSYS